ncbi:MAG TPA: thioredoxin domain-containing protein [Acidobacteriaceae bacterium]|jgi:protein-disulfide isomerase|nr:thioredoxin domain-containing protein [Acidobacteriaceae bacterium]
MSFSSKLRCSALTLAALAIVSLAPVGSIAATNPTQVRDASALKPPAGARVAILEFEDMECPVCGNVNPLLRQAVNQYKIPWTRHDFPLPYHAWSFQAAVNARWFDAKSKKLGDDYRDAVFASQPSITTLNVLRQFTEKFANDHKVGPMPFAVDPEGKFAGEVKADQALGQRIGIDHTPTIWIVTSGSRGAPFIEVLDPNKLYQIIDQALADTKSGK